MEILLVRKAILLNLYSLSLHDNIFCFTLCYKSMWIILLQRVLSRYKSEEEKYLQQIKIASVFCCSVQICICLIIRSNSWSVTNEDILCQWKNFLYRQSYVKRMLAILRLHWKQLKFHSCLDLSFYLALKLIFDTWDVTVA